jgi:hypothetical protein
VAWTIRAFMRKRSLVPYLVTVGVITAALASPFIVDLYWANQSETAAFPLTLTVRPFRITQQSLDQARVNEWLRRGTNALLLPLNYGIELGFFALAGVLYWRRRRQPVDVYHLALLLISLLLVTFLRSSIKNNDFGWRGVMPAQFILLLWASGSDFFNRTVSLPSRWRLSLRFALGLGVATTVSGLALLRSANFLFQYPQFQSSEIRALIDPQYTLAMRNFYRQIDPLLASDAVAQHNPDVEVEWYAPLFSSRQAVITDIDLGTLFGTNESEFEAVMDALAPIFVEGGDVNAVRREFGIDALVVKQSDPVWRDADSWVWQLDMTHSTEAARLYECPGDSN